MKKKVLSMMLAGAMTVSMLAGCGAGSDEAATTDNTAADTKTETAGTTEAGGGTAEASGNPVTLRTVSMFGGTDPNKETYEAINKEFMEQYDYITIEDNSQTSDEEWKAAVNADFSVGNEPDVIQFFTDATADSIIATDKLVSIEDIRAEYPDYAADTLDSALQAAANTDGVERAVPTTGYWEGLYCNKDLFDQYDLELPTDWASMETAIETFKENDIIPIACSLNNVPHYWIEFLMLYASGVDEYTSIPTSAPEGWVKGLEMFKTLRDMGAFPEYSLIWTGFIGAAYAFSTREHMALTLVRDKLTGRPHQILVIFIDALILLLAIFVITIGGYKLAVSARAEFSALLGVPRTLVYSIAPISGIFIIIAQIINLYEDITGNKVEE